MTVRPETPTHPTAKQEIIPGPLRIGYNGFLFLLFSLEFIVLSTNIYVGNLSWSTSNDDLHALFSQYGQVTSAHVIEDRDTGRSRGFGFVEMDTEGAQKSIAALNGTDFQGRSLKVNEAQPRENRSPRPRY